MSQSTRAQVSDAAGRAGRRRPWPARALAAVEAIVGVNAVVGGWKLIDDGYGMPVEWLSRLPVDTWVWPGVALIVGVAVPQFAAAAAAVLGDRPQRGYRLGLAVGAALVLWIVVQLALLQRYFFLQPVIVGFGLLEIGLALRWRHLVTAPS
ncbi:MAG TPA: hypothetical protein VIU11_12785 [Nakamurella sp.]